MSGLENSPIYEETRADHDAGAPARPEAEGVPAEEDVDAADLEERLDEAPEEAENQRDVPDSPENSYEARHRPPSDEGRA